MFTVFWDYRGIIQLEDMIKGRKIKYLDGKENKRKKKQGFFNMMKPDSTPVRPLQE
jgi:hypothetical protein